MINTELVQLKFNRSSPPYMEGELAAFPPEIAERYLKAKIARRPSKEDLVPPPPPKVEKLIRLRFVQSFDRFNRDEEASFPEAYAEQILEAKFAVRVDDEAEERKALEKAFEDPPKHKAMLGAPKSK